MSAWSPSRDRADMMVRRVSARHQANRTAANVDTATSTALFLAD